MWADPTPLGRTSVVMTAPASSSSLRATLTRHRAALIMGTLVVFTVLSLSQSSLLHSSSANSRYPFQLSHDSPVVVAQNNGNSHTYQYQQDTAVPPPKKHLRQETPAPSQLQRPDSFGLVIVADLDKKSKDESSKKPLFVSYLQHATLKITQSDQSRAESYAVSFGEAQRFTTTMNEAGRGFELSELTWFNGKLLSFDDRTGIVFRLKDFEGAKEVKAIPEHIIMEGDGVAGKGQKHEWATVKDGELYMGSVGKEFTDNDGNVIGDSNLWVAVMDASGDVRHEDWTSNFARVRHALECDYPGYVVHEAIEWSSVHRQWFILPRRVSQEAYNDMLDEQKGSNKMVIASEDFSTIDVVDVGKITPLRGFSSFKFLPRSDDSVIVAIKSVEVEDEHMQTSFITVFDIKGKVLLEETELPGGRKYEGIAFSHDWSDHHI